jgi:hypothetical protein
VDNSGPFADPFDTVNWPVLEQLAGVDDPGAVEPDTTPAIVTPVATNGARRRKRRGKRRKR